MLEDSRVIIAGWFGSALLGFLGGAAVFYSPTPSPVAGPPSSRHDAAKNAAAAPRTQPASAALMGSDIAQPFTPVPDGSVSSAAPNPGPRVLAGPAPSPGGSAGTQNSAAATRNALPIITINGITMQGDTVLSAPENPNDERRRARMAVDVSSIP